MKRKSLIVFLLVSFVALYGLSKVTITYWQYFYETRVNAIDLLIKEFEKENPDIDVVQETFPYEAFQQRVAAAIPAGKGPEVITLYYGWLPTWKRAGYVKPLPFTPDEAAFVPLIQVAKMEGKYWGLPTAVRSLALIYNKDMFDEAGVPAAPTTWEEFVEIGQKLTIKRGPMIIRAGFGIAPQGQDHHLVREVLIRQFGGQPYSDDYCQVMYDSPEGAAALKFYTDLQLKYEIGDVDFVANYRDGFIAGDIGMIIDGSFAIGTILKGAQFKVGFAELPVLEPGGTKANFASFWMHALTPRAYESEEKLEAAVKFLKFITSERAMRLWLEVVGELPARLTLIEDPELAQDPIYGPFIRALPYSYATRFYDEIAQRRIMLDAIDRVLKEGMDPADSLKIAAAEEQKILDEYCVSK
jgi:multiple sugar transport system substrate-binding protein